MSANRKLYLPYNVAPDVSPPLPLGGWTDSASMVAYKLLRARDSSVVTASVQINTPIGDNVGFLQFVSEPLAAGVHFAVADTMFGQIFAREVGSGTHIGGISAAPYNTPLLCGAWIVSEDGQTTRANLLTVSGAGGGVFGANPATELLNNATCRNKSLGTAGTPLIVAQDYVIVANDRFVLEVGMVAGAGLTPAGRFKTGGGSIGDAPVDETTTTAVGGWIELSTDVIFADEAPSTSCKMRTSRIVSPW